MSTTCKNTCSDGCKSCKKNENFSKFKRSLKSEKSAEICPLNISSYFFFKSDSYSYPSSPLSPREKKNLGAGFFKDHYRRDNSVINEITKWF